MASGANAVPERRKDSKVASTFDPIKLQLLALESSQSLNDYADKLYGAVNAIWHQRVAFYKQRMGERRTVLFVRGALIWLGIIALIATAFAGAARFTDIGGDWSVKPVDIALGIALVAYALMTALSFWESASAGSAAYFRGADIILALRDLWTQFEFDWTAILTKAGGDADAAKAELLTAARSVIASIDTLARTELGEWRGEVQTSLTQLASIGREGFEAMKADLEGQYDERIAKLEKQAEAKSKSYVTLDLEGQFEGEAEISLDEGASIRSAQPRVALPEMVAGRHRIRVTAKSEDKALSAAEWVNATEGPCELKISLA